MTGQEVPELAGFDRRIAAIMKKWHLPGGQLAIAKGKRLVLNQGYGYADVEKEELVQPDSLFRIGSVSKTITAVAILTLVDAGHLSLGDKAFRILDHLKLPKGATVDARFDEITVQNLLQHAGGFDTWKSYEPPALPWSRMAAGVLGVQDPPECETIIRYRMSMPLDFDPGTRTAYSNFGYCVLARVIETTVAAKTGKRVSYEDYVRSAVLQPVGISDMRLGRTRLSERAPGEVRYYPEPGQPLAPSVFPGEGYVPFAYGGYYVGSSDGGGGWIGSAVDLVRFALAIDGRRGGPLLSPKSVRRMLETPVPSKTQDERQQAGLCWTVKQREDGVDFWYTGGGKDSNASWLVRTHHGVTLAFTFNSLPADYLGFFEDVLPEMLERLKAVKSWPEIDLFQEP